MNSYTLNKNNSEVEYKIGKVKRLHKNNLNILIKESKQNKRKRKRYCLHDNVADPVHEMFIVHSKNTYIRPHLHKDRAESILILDGKIKYLIFNSKGKLKDVFLMTSLSNSRNAFYNRIKKDTYHSLIILSDTVTFLEITKGPFKKDSTKFAKWSPREESDTQGIKFLERKLKDYYEK